MIKDFTGRLSIENNYLYTNLSSCKFQWQLLKFPLAKDKKTGYTVITSGKTSIVLAAGKTGTLQLSFPANWMNADALSFMATDQYGRELYTWTWPIKQPAMVAGINLATSKKTGNSNKRIVRRKNSFNLLQWYQLSF